MIVVAISNSWFCYNFLKLNPMKNTLILGIALIVVGAAILAYQQISLKT